MNAEKTRIAINFDDGFVKSSLKTAIRSFRDAAESGDKDKASTAFLHASRQLDKAVSKGVIHSNQAANKKSAMAQRANSL